ncbi:leucine-rich repeat domain-containing protein [Rickettsia endosymbiont of Orchestes rusci]|uniref:hypothetical protein n=1 Tax=Rickettsia endosymbiont of Orchestes rusci TaxID=3066250 RepID=UPI00313BC122
MKELIDYLEKKGLKEKADSLRNGATTLSLYNNNIGDLGAKEISNVIQSNKSLTSLNLSLNKIGELGAREISNALKENKSLTELSLSGNNIGKATLETINEYIQRNRTIEEKKAEALNAEGNDLCHQEKYSEAIEKYKAAIKIKKELDSYDYSKDNLYEENKTNAEKKYEEQQQSLKLKQATSVTNENKPAEIKDLSKEVTKQDITQPNFTVSESMKALIEFLEKRGLKEEAGNLRNGVTTLNLSWKNIGKLGAKEISNVLKENTSLTSLNLSYNYIGELGAKEISNVLKENTSLTSLNLSYNNIGKLGAKELANVIRFNTSLTSLDLRSNNIGELGAKDIANVIRSNTSLTSLDLDSNSIGNAGAKELAAALQSNNSLTYIDLYGNKIGDEEKKLIAGYLQRNKNIAETNDKFQKLTDELNAKVAKDANIKDKSTMESTIKVISQKTKFLINKTDIEQVTVNIQELLANKLMKSKLIAIEEQLDELIEQQNINDDISVLGGDSTFG